MKTKENIDNFPDFLTSITSETISLKTDQLTVIFRPIFEEDSVPAIKTSLRLRASINLVEITLKKAISREQSLEDKGKIKLSHKKCYYLPKWLSSSSISCGIILEPCLESICPLLGNFIVQFVIDKLNTLSF